MTILGERAWSQADLAKRSGLSPGQISRIINGSRQAGFEACMKIAKACDLSFDLVCHQAGLMSAKTNLDSAADELVTLFGKLSDIDRKELLMIARFRAETHDN